MTGLSDRSLNASFMDTLKPRAVFRVVESVHGLRLIVDVVEDPVHIVAETTQGDVAEALSALLNRHPDEFCELLDGIRDRQPF